MIHRSFPWLAILWATIILFADYWTIVQARIVSVWHSQHQVEAANQIVFWSKLKEYETARLTSGDALRECPDTLSCPADGGPVVDRCCSPVMGLFVFVQQWYPKLGPKDGFTLHGLWPDECNGDLGPRDGCDAKRHYPNLGSIIKNNDIDLYNNMTLYWPSYKGHPESFWSHEWNKHGTCVSTLEPQCMGDTSKPYEDALTYFRTALTLRMIYDPYRALAAKNILPGNKYDLDLLTNTLEEAWGVPVRITCRRGQISEIWLWMKVRGRDQYVPVPPVRPKDTKSCGHIVYYPPKGSDSI